MRLLQQARDLALSSDARVLNAIGYANDPIGNYDVAEAAFQQAGKLHPDDGGAFNNLGMSYLRQDRFDKAVNAFQIALYRDPTPTIARLHLRIALATRGNLRPRFPAPVRRSSQPS